MVTQVLLLLEVGLRLEIGTLLYGLGWRAYHHRHRHRRRLLNLRMEDRLLRVPFVSSFEWQPLSWLWLLHGVVRG